ncbi:hypothetical protein DEO72_LG2g1489 [Vigna unguiculata]|uniref:Uncharacterized protein n=1 Tax=Vigna unguiculata TaxID=3917 RepID=A0A4D6KXK8_VIGUN|nr:hypothetical protein DEO72_LG2g1489 [Vigna unguiculata]
MSCVSGTLKPPLFGVVAGAGPLRVKEVVGKCAYRWEHLSGVSIPTTRNASHLKYYS